MLDDDPWLWHRRFGHVSQTLLQELNSQNLVIGLPKAKFVVDKVCKECARCKHVRSSFKPKQVVSTTRPLELVHVDLCGPVRLQNRNAYQYVFVVVDDYSRFTWTLFLTSKEEAFDAFLELLKKLEKQLDLQLVALRFDHGTEFDNSKFIAYCNENGINHNFSAPRTQQQNGVVERKNRSL